MIFPVNHTTLMSYYRRPRTNKSLWKGRNFRCSTSEISTFHTRASAAACYSLSLTPILLGLGKGIGLVIALVILQLIGSLCQHHFFYRATSTGVLLRGGLIMAIYSRYLRLTTRVRATLSNGRLVNHIPTDVCRIDYCLYFFPHVVGGTHPDDDQSCPTDIQFGTE